ncbi:hypothetical protein KI387_030131, partial [Taxus chinensis]
KRSGAEQSGVLRMTTYQLSLQKSSGGGLKSPELARRPPLRLSKTSPQTATTLPKTDFRPTENFTRFKQTAVKLVQDQDCAKTDLQIANSKLKKSAEQILRLEIKLQYIGNTNAKLKLKQNEDAKLWRGLDSKLSSTKMFCNELTETLQHLALKVEEAEGSKQFLEEKLTERLKAFEELSVHWKSLSSRLNTAEETIEKREHELQDLLIENEQVRESYDAEVIRTNLLTAEKDHTEKQLQATVEEDFRAMENVQNQLKEVQKLLSLKENACASLHVMQSKLQTEKAQLKAQIQEYEEKLLTTESQREALRDEILRLSDKVIELEKVSLVASKNVDNLLQEIDKTTKLAQKEKILAREKAQVEFGHLNGRFQDAISANASLQAQIQESNNQITELQKILDLRTEEYAKKEFEAEAEINKARKVLDKTIDNKCQLEQTIVNMQENIAFLSHSLSEAQKDKEDLMINISKLKAENQDAHGNFQVTVRQKEEEIETLLKKIVEDKLAINLRDTEISQLQQESINKAQLMMQVQERQKDLEEQNAKISAQVLAAEHSVIEIRRQCELQIEAKQAELTRHLKEISQRNDQEINDIRRRCKEETRESILREQEKEKSKADAMLKEEKQNTERRVEKIQEDASRCLQHVQEEHGSLVKRLREEHDKEKLLCRVQNTEEMNKKQQQFEKDLEEQCTKLMRDAEVKVKDVQIKHGEEMQKLHNEQNLQWEKEEEKRALIELQIKILKDKLQEQVQRKEDDLQMNMNKEFSISSTQVKAIDCKQEKQVPLIRHTKVDEMPPRPSLKAVDKIRPKSERARADSLVSIPTTSLLKLIMLMEIQGVLPSYCGYTVIIIDSIGISFSRIEEERGTYVIRSVEQIMGLAAKHGSVIDSSWNVWEEYPCYLSMADQLNAERVFAIFSDTLNHASMILMAMYVLLRGRGKPESLGIVYSKSIVI